MSATEFDLEHWVSVFPIETIRTADSWYVQGHSITSPFHLAVVEQIRWEVGQRSNLGQAIPADVFVFGKGEGPTRAGTKIGGLPYRPAGISWPTTRDDGQAMTFVGQFNFRKSKDITGPLPGDILLVFARNDMPSMDDPDEFRFEWYNEDLTDLIVAADVPKPAWPFVVCYGVRCRSADFPEAQSLFSDYGSSYRIAILEGTKIGGVPPFLWEIEESGAKCGRFLASIGSVKAVKDRAYPWINEPSPRTTDDEELMWGDLGVVDLFLDDDWNIQWWVGCY